MQEEMESHGVLAYIFSKAADFAYPFVSLFIDQDHFHFAGLIIAVVSVLHFLHNFVSGQSVGGSCNWEATNQENNINNKYWHMKVIDF
jgi:hypothetical protein